MAPATVRRRRVAALASLVLAAGLVSHLVSTQLSRYAGPSTRRSLRSLSLADPKTTTARSPRPLTGNNYDAQIQEDLALATRGYTSNSPAVADDLAAALENFKRKKDDGGPSSLRLGGEPHPYASKSSELADRLISNMKGQTQPSDVGGDTDSDESGQPTESGGSDFYPESREGDQQQSPDAAGRTTFSDGKGFSQLSKLISYGGPPEGYGDPPPDPDPQKQQPEELGDLDLMTPEQRDEYERRAGIGRYERGSTDGSSARQPDGQSASPGFGSQEQPQTPQQKAFNDYSAAMAGTVNDFYSRLGVDESGRSSEQAEGVERQKRYVEFLKGSGDFLNPREVQAARNEFMHDEFMNGPQPQQQPQSIQGHQRQPQQFDQNGQPIQTMQHFDQRTGQSFAAPQHPQQPQPLSNNRYDFNQERPPAQYGFDQPQGQQPHPQFVDPNLNQDQQQYGGQMMQDQQQYGGQKSIAEMRQQQYASQQMTPDQQQQFASPYQPNVQQYPDPNRQSYFDSSQQMRPQQQQGNHGKYGANQAPAYMQEMGLSQTDYSHKLADGVDSFYSNLGVSPDSRPQQFDPSMGMQQPQQQFNPSMGMHQPQHQHPDMGMQQPQLQQQSGMNDFYDRHSIDAAGLPPDLAEGIAQNREAIEAEMAKMDAEEAAENGMIGGYGASTEEFAGDPPDMPQLAPLAQYPVTTYSLEDANRVPSAFHFALFYFVYDSASDTFVLVHNKKGPCPQCDRIYNIASFIARALRRNFPQHFRGRQSTDLVFLVSIGDAPRIRQQCLVRDEQSEYCDSHLFAPILQFGTVLTNEDILPSMIPMPLPIGTQVPCYDEYQWAGTVCKPLASLDLRRSDPESAAIADREGYWDDLIPQIVWRGSDVVMLKAILYPDMRSPVYDEDLGPYEDESGPGPPDERWAISRLWNLGHSRISPRWRAVLLSAQAEIESREFEKMGNAVPPWIDAKFTHYLDKGEKKEAAGNIDLVALKNRVNIDAIGEEMSRAELAKYKYHLDLGGASGSPWQQTLEKMALPGLLFHHMTPTKVWFHDLMIPWVHFVPVSLDLSDLRQKFIWAESHPEEAVVIAEEGTKFARWLASKEGIEYTYKYQIVQKLERDIIEAFVLPPRFQGRGVLKNVLNSSKQGFDVFTRCSGKRRNSCEGG